MGYPGKPISKGSQLIDTLAITESLGLQTFRRDSRKTWLKQDDEQLLERLKQLYPKQEADQTLNAKYIDWEAVAVTFKGERKAKDCRKRWTSSLNPNLRRGKWTAEEDQLLIESFKKYGKQWQQVANQIEGRTEHQCSKRYFEVLDPNVRNRLKPWSEAEDLHLIELVSKNGTKWKTIASEFSGRPALTCRNRWRNLVTSVVRGRASSSISEKISSMGAGNPLNQPGGDVSSATDSLMDIDVQVEDSQGVVSETSTNTGTKSEARFNPQSTEYGNADASSTGTTHRQSDIRSIGGNSTWAQSATFKAENWRRQDCEQENSSSRGPAASEWKYTVSSNTSLPTDHPLRILLTHGGNIRSEQLANHLVSCAAHYGLQVTIHQHHYYGRHSTQNRYTGNYGNEIGLAFNDVGHDFRGRSTSHFSAEPLSSYSTAPETQLQRHQHFNYLPSSAQVPKLTSSAGSPEFAGKATTTHHHHHHYHHELGPREMQQGNSTEYDVERDSANKESDLFKLLNEHRNQQSPEATGSNAKAVEENDYKPRSRSLTPLTQMGENGVVEFLKRNADISIDPSSKRHQKELSQHNTRNQLFEGVHQLDAARRDSLMSYLNAPYQGTSATKSSHQGAIEAMEALQNVSGLTTIKQPVSQHHPLHYSSNSLTPRPETLVDDEEEEHMYDHGFFYMRDKPMEPMEPMEPSEISEDSDVFGTFPFNPS